MYNRINQVLEQYPFAVNRSYKGRGVVICETDQGLKSIKEYKGSPKRADFLYEVLEFIRQEDRLRADYVVKTKEDAALAKDEDETLYLARDFYEGKECDPKSRDDILRAVRELAALHKRWNDYDADIPDFLKRSTDALYLEYEKHSREMKKVRQYIRSKRKKNDFELSYLNDSSVFLEQAEEVIRLQEEAPEREEWYGICHGDFNHHNVLFSREGTTILNFEHSFYGLQVSDLSNFMRKILEKHNWNQHLGLDMLDSYQKVRALTETENRQLYIRLAYPEKFWKISNHYYNTGKVWVCGRNLEKLERLIGQNEERMSFLQILSHKLLFS